MKYLSIISIVLSFALLSSCGKKKEPIQEVPTTAPQVRAQFIPNADSSVSIDQVKNWLACNPLLDSLVFLYSDSFKVADQTKHLRYQEDFLKAQDKICKLAGLPGGFREYRWIMESMGNDRNAKILESLQISVY